MALRFALDIETMTFDDMIEMAEMEEITKPGPRMRQMKALMAKFMVDDEGKPLEHEAALAALGGLPMSQVTSTMKEFSRLVTEGMGDVLPNE